MKSSRRKFMFAALASLVTVPLAAVGFKKQPMKVDDAWVAMANKRLAAHNRSMAREIIPHPDVAANNLSRALHEVRAEHIRRYWPMESEFTKQFPDPVEPLAPEV